MTPNELAAAIQIAVEYVTIYILDFNTPLTTTDFIQPWLCRCSGKSSSVGRYRGALEGWRHQRDREGFGKLTNQ